MQRRKRDFGTCGNLATHVGDELRHLPAMPVRAIEKRGFRSESSPSFYEQS